MSVSTLDEVRLTGELPLWEVPGWLHSYGISAGITGRSTSSGAAFDLGLRGQRPVGEVMADWHRFQNAFPEGTGMTLARQSGGSEVLWHEHIGAGWNIAGEADGHITPLPDRLLLVTVADCVPVYLAAPAQGVIALLHSGWRGTAGGILRQALLRLAARGIRPGDLVMHCGVAIAGRSYQVGREVMDAVGVAAHGEGPWYLDLREVLAEQGKALGIKDITISSLDTASRPADFYSWRASAGADGRMVAWIGRPSSLPTY